MAAPLRCKHPAPDAAALSYAAVVAGAHPFPSSIQRAPFTAFQSRAHKEGESCECVELYCCQTILRPQSPQNGDQGQAGCCWGAQTGRVRNR